MQVDSKPSARGTRARKAEAKRAKARRTQARRTKDRRTKDRNSKAKPTRLAGQCLPCPVKLFFQRILEQLSKFQANPLVRANVDVLVILRQVKAWIIFSSDLCDSFFLLHRVLGWKGGILEKSCIWWDNRNYPQNTRLEKFDSFFLLHSILGLNGGILENSCVWGDHRNYTHNARLEEFNSINNLSKSRILKQDPGTPRSKDELWPQKEDWCVVTVRRRRRRFVIRTLLFCIDSSFS